MKTVKSTMKTAKRGTEWSSVILDRAASGKVEPGRRGSSRMDEWSLGPFGICDYDGPETVRLRKYATGTHVLLEEIDVETGATPREVVWSKSKAKLFRYLRPDERPGEGLGRRRSVPVLLTYGFVLKPYVLDLVPGNSMVEYLVGEGFDVYMLDLGISDASVTSGWADSVRARPPSSFPLSSSTSAAGPVSGTSCASILKRR